MAIAHFYFDYQEQELQTPAYFMASLLKQLVLQKSRFPFLVIELYEQLKRERTHAIAAELLETLQKLGATFDRCFLVIDALDECDGKKHRREVLQILENLKQAHFKIFVTSRPHPHDILRLLGKETRIHVEADEADLKIFCSSMINSNDNLCELVDEALREDIISTIVKNAQGMFVYKHNSYPYFDGCSCLLMMDRFLLPFLQMQEILDQMTKSEIRKCLRKLSANLDRVFENTIARIKREPQNRQRVAMQTLMWIRFAFRPLHVDELRHALAIQLGDSEFDPDNLLPIRSIIESCSGLVVLDDQSSTIRLVHYTLQEYLISNQEKLFPDGDDHITNMCLTYLCLNSILDIPNLDISGIQTTLRQFPFLEYALSHWGNHAKKATTSKRSDSSSGRELELKYLTNNLKITCACQVLDFTSSLSAQGRNHYQTYRHESGLHVAASFGLESLVIELLDKKIDVNSRDSDMNTALHKAVLKSHYLTTRKLIEEGVDIDAQNVERNTALYVAVSRSDYPLAELLLENKADPNILCDFGWTTIHKAADVGDSSLVELLINNHANIFVKTKRELIALHQAARRGHTDVVRLLLDRGSLVNATTCDGWTPLDASSSSGKLEVVRLLLERGADINASCNIKRTPLHRACRSGHTQTVEHLVLKGADVLAKDSKDQLPIHRAAKGGNKKTIKILLSRNPCQQLSATCPCGITARGEAFAAGQWKTARVLRQQELYWLGASLEKRDDLSVAIEEYSVKKVEKLLDQGFDINRKDADGLTPLHQALQMSTPDIALSILQYGADIEAETVDGWRPIHSAARRGSEDLVRLCLEYNADSLARTGDGQTALHKVCESTNLNAARLLLENEVDIEAADKWGYRPLHTAATTGRQDTVKLLLEYGADLGAKVLDGRSVQACAAKGGHHDLADYIYQCQKLPLAHFDCDRSTNLREH